jgi:hypothetical protein
MLWEPVCPRLLKRADALPSMVQAVGISRRASAPLLLPRVQAPNGATPTLTGPRSRLARHTSVSASAQTPTAADEAQQSDPGPTVFRSARVQQPSLGQATMSVTRTKQGSCFATARVPQIARSASRASPRDSAGVGWRPRSHSPRCERPRPGLPHARSGRAESVWGARCGSPLTLASLGRSGCQDGAGGALVASPRVVIRCGYSCSPAVADIIGARLA